MKANQDTCPHPATKWRTPSFGRTVCGRCDGDLTLPGREFEHRHSARITLAQGDLVRVKAGTYGSAFHGSFQYAEHGPSGLYYCVIELQKGAKGGHWHAAVRYVRPERVRREGKRGEA